MADSDRRTPEVARPMEERTHRADLWEAGADERERLADERERLADERDRLAEEREWLADRHDHALGRREVENRARTPTSIHSVEEAAAQAAMQRAEARLRRADAELRSARQAAARQAAGAARGAAAAERAAAAAQVEQSLYSDQHAWLADRRDFIAAHRDQVAELRDGAADERDETAAVREGLADIREREMLDRERELEPSRRPGRAGSTNWAPTRQDRARHVEQRTSAERQREQAAASRRAAAQDRSRTAALWGPQAYGPELVASFARLAQQLFRSEEYTDLVPEVLKFAVDAVAGCDHASVTLYRHDHVVDTVTSDPVAAELDEIQFGSGLGPAPEAMHSDHPVYAPRLHGLAALAGAGRHRCPARRRQLPVLRTVYCAAGAVVTARHIHPLQRGA